MKFILSAFQKKYFFVLVLLCAASSLFAQDMTIRGFIDQITLLQDKKVSFNLGEQDLFITADLNDRFSFLGESVFKFSIKSPTSFDVSIERAVIKYNYFGNHNIFFGKQHTPVNYWNDTYHHGKVFYPTIWRPSMFTQHIVPLHTEGMGLQGHDLGKIHFGYDFMIGNGLGSTDVLDNDLFKSVTAAVHIKPIIGLRIGASVYLDHISKGSVMADMPDTVMQDIDQKIYSGTVAYFGHRFEFLSEASAVQNATDTSGSSQTIAWYVYGGVKFLKKFTAYGRFDQLRFENTEMYFHSNNQYAAIAGLRYQINFLAVVKAEYERDHSALGGDVNKVEAEIAVGF